MSEDARTFDQELLAWLWNEPADMRSEDAERVREIAAVSSP